MVKIVILLGFVFFNLNAMIGSRVDSRLKDPLMGAVVTLEPDHYEIHEGDHYFICSYESKNVTEQINYIVTTPNTDKYLHMVFDVFATDKVSVNVYEAISGVTIGAGSTIIPKNNNRNSSNLSVGTFVKDPDTVSNLGTLLFSQSSGANKDAGNISRDKEIILLKNTSYLFRIISGANSNIISYCANWYEH